MTPDQITALQDGETIRLRIPIEWMTSDWALHMDYDILDHPTRILVRSHGGAYDEERYPPVAVGDTVEVACACKRGDGPWCAGCWPEMPDDCILRPTVRSIAHTEQDGVHYWELEVSQ